MVVKGTNSIFNVTLSPSTINVIGFTTAGFPIESLSEDAIFMIPLIVYVPLNTTLSSGFCISIAEVFSKSWICLSTSCCVAFTFANTALADSIAFPNASAPFGRQFVVSIFSALLTRSCKALLSTFVLRASIANWSADVLASTSACEMLASSIASFALSLTVTNASQFG